MDIRYSFSDGRLELTSGGKVLVMHSPATPFLRAGSGEGQYSMYRGNYDISERLDELVELRDAELLEFSVHTKPDQLLEGDSLVFRFSRAGLYPVTVRFSLESGRLVLKFKQSGTLNRWLLSLPSAPSDHVYGCGEQFSYFDLRGKKFPLWTSEQGVGRNKKTAITFQADTQDRCGGDYWWTFYPQPTFVSSAGFWYHLETSAYAEFDFSQPESHRLYAWELPSLLVMGGDSNSTAALQTPAKARQEKVPNMAAVVSDLGSWFGRQRCLPDWVHDGVILGIQGGTSICLEKMQAAREAGVPVNGIWAQDWEGINITSFGQRLRWDWIWNEVRYPGLDRKIHELESEGVKFLGYINCYVGAGWKLFTEAQAGGYLAKNSKGEDYLVDFGEFDAGIVDFTNPAAFEWYKTAIRKHLVEFGLSGWMADFGEYLPTDAILHSRMDATIAHNLWPALWARCVHEAVEEAGASDRIFWFMRAGFTGNQRWCPCMWAGDQNVDWSEDDGLPSVITSALSLGMCGHGLHHSDIGGYTTLYGMKRSKELFMRWTEQAAFSPVMRTHEGNRPKDNWQFDSDLETLEHLAAMTKVHVALKPYILAAEKENEAASQPVMRPLFFGHEDEEAVWSIKDQYFLGPDLLVAPVIVEKAVTRKLYLPFGSWTDFWTGLPVGPGGQWIEVDAPLGKPPVFVSSGSGWSRLFQDAVRSITLEE